MFKTITNPSVGDPAAPDANRHQRKFETYHHPQSDAFKEEARPTSNVRPLPSEFLIDTPTIRNELNSLKTNDRDSV
jgi:hypothetical protein